MRTITALVSGFLLMAPALADNTQWVEPIVRQVLQTQQQQTQQQQQQEQQRRQQEADWRRQQEDQRRQQEQQRWQQEQQWRQQQSQQGQQNQQGWQQPQPQYQQSAQGNRRSSSSGDCAQWKSVNVQGGQYIVHNNFYNRKGNGSQCISIDAGSGAFSISGNHAVPPNGPPGGYPSIFKGCHWGKCTSNSGMPIPLSRLSAAPSHWRITAPPPGNWNATFDIWFNRTPNTNGQPDGAELMIWLDRSGAVQPIGVREGNVLLEGISFDVWIERAGAGRHWNVISYVANRSVGEANVDLKRFFDDARGRGLLDPNWYLITVEAGFEGWSGFSGARSDSFSVSIR